MLEASLGKGFEPRQNGREARGAAVDLQIDRPSHNVFTKAQLHHGTLLISSLRTGGQAVSRVPSPVSFQGCWAGSVSV